MSPVWPGINEVRSCLCHGRQTPVGRRDFRDALAVSVPRFGPASGSPSPTSSTFACGRCSQSTGSRSQLRRSSSEYRCRLGYQEPTGPATRLRPPRGRGAPRSSARRSLLCAQGLLACMAPMPERNSPRSSCCRLSVFPATTGPVRLRRNGHTHVVSQVRSRRSIHRHAVDFPRGAVPTHPAWPPCSSGSNRLPSHRQGPAMR